MQIWWHLPPLFVIVVSSCITGFYTNTTPACSNKESGVNSFLWTIHRHPPAYLFGTIHVPYNRVWDWIPENSKTAFLNSDSTIFELDLGNHNTMAVLGDCQMLPQGSKLSDHLPEELYARLERHLDYVRTRMPFCMRQDRKQNEASSTDDLYKAITASWRRKRPVWVLLMINTLNEADSRARGVPVLDLHLAQMAESGGKSTGAVERVEEQCGLLNKLNISQVCKTIINRETRPERVDDNSIEISAISEQVLFAINKTLWQQEILRDQGLLPPCNSEALIQHYNCGNLSSFLLGRDTTRVPVQESSSLSWMELEKARRVEQYFHDELVDKRNARMTDRVIDLLHRYPGTSFFFAFGAGHFLGKGSVVDRLGHAGFTVEHTDPSHGITRTNKPSQWHPGKSRTFIQSSDGSQHSDVVYRDFRVRQLKRHKKARLRQFQTRERQEKLDFIWEGLDARIPGNIRRVEEVSFKYGVYTQNTYSHGNPSAHCSAHAAVASFYVFQAVMFIRVCVLGGLK